MLLGFEHVNIVCSDLDRSLRFYVDLIGWKVKVRKVTPDGGQLAFVEVPGAQLEIFQPKDRAKTPARPVPRSEAGFGHISFTVDDVEAEFKRLSDEGVEFTERPRLAINKELFYKICFCRDPDGNPVELCQRRHQL